jgi:hypothetical protein
MLANKLYLVTGSSIIYLNGPFFTCLVYSSTLSLASKTNSKLSAVLCGFPFHLAIKLKVSFASAYLFLVIKKLGVSGNMQRLTSPNKEHAKLIIYKYRQSLEIVKKYKHTKMYAVASKINCKVLARTFDDDGCISIL